MKPNENVYPHGGRFFKESDGSTHRAETWPGVISRVRAYRKRNRIAEGNVEAEVYAQACAREPSLCTNADDAAHEKAVRKTNLKVRMLQWLSALIKDKSKFPTPFVSAELAKERANICAGCPHNTPLQDGCATCKAAISELRRSVIGERAVDGRLHGCEILGTDLGANVHIDEVRCSIDELPGFCWRKIVH